MTISATQFATQRSTAVAELAPLLNDARPVIGVLDFNILDQSIEQLCKAYPAHWITHNVALSTISLPGVLEHFRTRGLGAVTSSASELDIAQGSGFTPHGLIHHAGTNTWSMLRQLIDSGVGLSVDNFAELSRVDALVKDLEQVPSGIGLSVTAQPPVEDDEPARTQRGIGLRDHRQHILEAHLDRVWLNQLHLNFNAPPNTLQQAAEYLAAIYHLAEDIEHAAGEQRIQRLYIAEGIATSVSSGSAESSMDQHRFVQQAMVPEIFDGKYEIVTDFSEQLTTSAGTILARVEYTKDLDGKLLAGVHAQTAFNDTLQQSAQIEAYDAEGDLKDRSVLYYYDVAGPHGLIGHQVQLPELEEGDVLAMLNVGAQTFGAASTFAAPVYGIRPDGLLTETSVLHAGRSTQELAQAAGVYQPEKRLS